MTADLRLVPDPPSDTRTNLRPMARATDSPSDVLPTPGGPTSAEDGAAAAAADHAQATPGSALTHGQVLDDALLDVIQAGVVHRIRRAPAMS